MNDKPIKTINFTFKPNMAKNGQFEAHTTVIYEKSSKSGISRASVHILTFTEYQHLCESVVMALHKK